MSVSFFTINVMKKNIILCSSVFFLSGCFLEQKEIFVPPGLEALDVMKLQPPANDEVEGFNSLSGEADDVQVESYG